MKLLAHATAIAWIWCLPQLALAQTTLKVLTNHIGYEAAGSKCAVVLGHDSDDVKSFRLIDELTGNEALRAVATKAGRVDQWKDWCFWTADFSPLRAEGTYLIELTTGAGPVRSFPFRIQRDLLERS